MESKGQSTFQSLDHAERLRLFRSQPMRERDVTFGRPASEQVASERRMGLVIATLIAGALLAAAIISIPVQEVARGYLVPSRGYSSATAEHTGRVAEVLMHKGARVHQGTPIARIETDLSLWQGYRAGLERHNKSLDLERLSGQRVNAAKRLLDNEVMQARERLNSLVERILLAKEAVALHARRLEVVREGRNEQAQLLGRGFVSPAHFRESELRATEAEQTLLEKRRELTDLLAAQEQARLQLGRLSAQSDYELASVRGDQLNAAMRSEEISAANGHLLLAPSDGILASLDIKSGDVVRPGQVAAMVMPSDDRLEAEVWLSSKAAAMVNKGMAVKIKYDAFPFQRYGIAKGEVLAIDKVPSQPVALPFRFDLQEPGYRMRVQLRQQSMQVSQKNAALMAGTLLTAEIVLESRSVLAWVIEPIRHLQARLDDGKQQ
jgi:membrane fusion protein